MTKEKLIRIVLAVLMGVGGFALIASSDWKIAIGVFILMWADNIDKNAEAK